jgi:hypothetical protein
LTASTGIQVRTDLTRVNQQLGQPPGDVLVADVDPAAQPVQVAALGQPALDPLRGMSGYSDYRSDSGIG